MGQTPGCLNESVTKEATGALCWVCTRGVNQVNVHGSGLERIGLAKEPAYIAMGMSSQLMPGA